MCWSFFLLCERKAGWRPSEVEGSVSRFCSYNGKARVFFLGVAVCEVSVEVKFGHYSDARI